ncbi:unnamed protein product [Peniophora sp. CBMAI 1063]|nr:unnamed protein product [Peniophora sp. CBMAI 1063]
MGPRFADLRGKQHPTKFRTIGWLYRNCLATHPTRVSSLIVEDQARTWMDIGTDRSAQVWPSKVFYTNSILPSSGWHSQLPTRGVNDTRDPRAFLAVKAFIAQVQENLPMRTIAAREPSKLRAWTYSYVAAN